MRWSGPLNADVMHRVEMSATLTDRTRELLALVPAQSDRERILQLYEEKPALYGPPTVEVLERVRFAVIALAMRDSRGLEIAEKLYKVDTRDLLVNAEFATDLAAHDKWCASMLKSADE